MKFGMVFIFSALLLNGCGNNVDSSDHETTQEKITVKNQADARGFDLSKFTFYTSGVCLSNIRTLHNIFAPAAPEYEFEYRCFYATDSGPVATSRKLNDQITESNCPTKFEIVERVIAGLGQIKLKVTPTQRPQMYISTNVKKSYDEQLAKSKCDGIAHGFTEKKTSLGDPAWTNVEVMP